MKKTKRISLLTAVSALAVCASCGIAAVASSGDRAANADTPESAGWYNRNDGKDGYTLSADGDVTVKDTDNNGWNFYINGDGHVYNDYTLSVDILGTIEQPSDGNAQLGIVPWYVNNDNYIVIYAEWWAGDRAGQMKCLQFTGMVNGVDVGWNDFWTDGVTAAPADGIRLCATKTDGTFTFYAENLDGNKLKEGTKTVSLTNDVNAVYGIYGNGDLALFSDITLTENSYYVTLDRNGGTFAAGTEVIQNVAKGGKMTKPADPTRDGYDFSGWYVGNEQFDFDAELTKSVTLTAKWAIKQYDITFDYNDGETTTTTDKVEHNGTVTQPSAPIRDGYEFVGWYIQGSETVYNFSTPVTSNLTLVARWEQGAVVRHEVAFVTNGGGDVEAINVVDGGKISAPTVTRDGYVLDGWFTDEELTLPFDFANDTVTADITLYAKWNEVSYTATFVYADGQTANKTATVGYNEKLTRPANPVRDGYLFDGWYAEGETSPFDFNSVLTADVTLTARWVKDAGWRGGSGYSVDEESGTIYSDNSTGMYINNNLLLAGTYNFSADITGAMTLPTKQTHYAGIVPWYLDENNYIVVYVEYSDSDRPGQVREIQITGRINGGNLDNAEWHDFWCDGITIDPSAGYKLKVSLTRDGSGGDMMVTAELLDSAGNSKKSGNLVLPKLNAYAAKPFRYGVIAKVDNYTIENLDPERIGGDDQTEYALVGNGVVAKSAGTAWTITGGSYTVDGGDNDISSTMLIKRNALGAASYKLSADVSGANGKVGLIAWYEDENNYIFAVYDNGKYGFEGKLLGTPIVQPAQGDISEAVTKLTVYKRGSVLELLINDMEEGEGVKFEDALLQTAASYGLCASGAATFAELTIDDGIDYKAYSWYMTELNNRETFVSAAAMGGVAYDEENGKYVFRAAGVTDEHDTSVYWATDYYDKAEISAVFTDVSNTTEYGLYGWLQDQSKYVLAKVTPRGVVIISTLGETTESEDYALPEGFEYAGEHTLAVATVNDKVTVTLDGNVVAKDVAVSGIDHDKKARLGIAVSHTAVNAAVTESGYTSFTPVIQDGWTLQGNRYNSWTVEEDGTVNGSLVGDTVFLRTLALKDNVDGKKDYFMSANVKITEHTGAEWKAGFAPYYVDGDNYVFVWFTRWADGSPQIGVTAKLNGAVLPPEWRETEFSYNFFDTNSLEVSIQGNTLSVYVNKQFLPIVSYELDGLGDRQMTGAKSALYINNVSATFADIVTFGDKRVIVNTDKPTISMTGTKPATGEVGKRVTLPIITASNEAGDTLTVEKTITGPNGETVEIDKNGFTPTVAGKYTVTCTCTDMWGNKTVEEFTVTVSDAGGSVPGTTPDATGNNDTNSNLGLILGLAIGIPVALAAVAGAIVLLIKKGVIKLKRKKSNGNNVEDNNDGASDNNGGDAEETEPVQISDDESAE